MPQLAHTRLPQYAEHQTPELVIIMSSPTGGNFFASVKSFDANIFNFVLIEKKLEYDIKIVCIELLLNVLS